MPETVIIYTKTGCPYCKAAKEDLNKKGVTYQEINISDNPGKIEEMVKIAGTRKVPVIVEADKVTVGYNGGG